MTRALWRSARDLTCGIVDFSQRCKCTEIFARCEPTACSSLQGWSECRRIADVAQPLNPHEKKRPAFRNGDGISMMGARLQQRSKASRADDDTTVSGMLEKKSSPE